ncbi:hypothetical protein CE91St64_34290 [Faecalicatena contorta]|nr:hypothetical protein CE91St64_34290 [Faecalicatena contorta]
METHSRLQTPLLLSYAHPGGRAPPPRKGLVRELWMEQTMAWFYGLGRAFYV